jgi:hypothetical protein
MAAVLRKWDNILRPWELDNVLERIMPYLEE